MGDAEIIQLKLPDDGAVLVRALPVAGGGDNLDSADAGPSNVGLREALSLSAISTALRGVATTVQSAFQSVKPDVVEAEFGLEFALKGSQMVCLLVDGETKATLRVRLEWQNGSVAGNA
ncbi:MULTISPECIES: CU044_2847 family protein [Streptomyces]|uniref:CU044_2847 family protein n=1 Tax=Streptomyces TaxID=1883 RepID=UPI002931C9B1|nr:CU044_2847 family protein [Streptomyces sp. NEAU-HV9]